MIFRIIKVRRENPKHTDRGVFDLSCGHSIVFLLHQKDFGEFDRPDIPSTHIRCFRCEAEKKGI
jgi:hypothetical protein